MSERNCERCGRVLAPQQIVCTYCGSVGGGRIPPEKPENLESSVESVKEIYDKAFQEQMKEELPKAVKEIAKKDAEALARESARKFSKVRDGKPSAGIARKILGGLGTFGNAIMNNVEAGPMITGNYGSESSSRSKGKKGKKKNKQPSLSTFDPFGAFE